MTERMRTSAAGLELIKTFEGLRETAVRLPDGRWTIGYGHVRTAREGLTIAAADAEQLLILDLRPIETAISAMIFAPLMQGQFDALVSLAYNISLGQFRDSEIVSHLNAGNYLAAANGFDLWRKARLHGRVMVVDALVRRRAAEKAMFLHHPSGPPSAPTPLVPPELDLDSADLPRARSTPASNDDVEPEAPPAPASDIAEAVRRLAERTQKTILPPAEIPLPPGSVVAAADPAEEEPAATSVQPAETQAERIAPVTAEQIASASVTVAERVARILNGVEQKIQAASAEPSSAGRLASTAQPDVREGLPDFDLPPERFEAEAIGNSRRLIDDTEIVEPGRDPARMFREAERKAKVVNGHARRVGPLSGRLLVLAPWLVVLALSVLGFAIGTVDAFKDSGLQAGVPRLAATILAVFGVMLVMSLYFIFWKRASDEA